MRMRYGNVVGIIGLVVGSLGGGAIIVQPWLWKVTGRPAAVPNATMESPAPAEGCAIPAVVIERFPEFLREYRRTGRGDPKRFGRRMYACAVERSRETPYVTMLRDAAKTNDSIARLALDGIARATCDAHAALGGVTTAHASDACVHVVSFIGSGQVTDVQERERAVRVASRASVLRAGLSLPQFIVGEFCSDLAALAPRTRDRLLARYPDLDVLRTDYCGTSTAVLLPHSGE
ncbi:hypothetical protein HYV74_00750 [Candidatus Uhrbacteria bacterium]|nr:hypothetical protein [Candidatus Uhrbacteria bacterium]